MRSFHRFHVFQVFVVLASLCVAQGNAEPLFRNPDRPLDERVEDLRSRLTLEEKASLVVSDSPGVKRLGIPAYNWWNEALHGVARAGEATVFPQAIGLAAMWDASFMREIAETIGIEGRAKYHAATVERGSDKEAAASRSGWSAMRRNGRQMVPLWLRHCYHKAAAIRMILR